MVGGGLHSLLSVPQELQNQVLNTLFNLCKINRTRQEQAALAGIIPHLKEIIVTSPYVTMFGLDGWLTVWVMD